MSFHQGLFTRFTAIVFMAIGSILGLSNSAQAATIPFDPDGGANGFINIDNLDFSPGNSLFRSIGTLLSDKSNQASTLYIQTRVGNIGNATLGDVTPAALNVSYELTMYMQVPILATVSGDDTVYSIDAGASTFELWYDNNIPATQSAHLPGTGFRQGTQILAGTFVTADGSFTRGLLGGPVLMDQFGADDYAGFQTQQVIGGGAFDVLVTSADPGFFGVVPPELQFVLADTSTITPFDTANPSQLFDGYAPSRGNVNGQGPDLAALADAAASFTVIPEPSIWLLLSVASLAGLAWGRRS